MIANAEFAEKPKKSKNTLTLLSGAVNLSLWHVKIAHNLSYLLYTPLLRSSLSNKYSVRFGLQGEV